MFEGFKRKNRARAQEAYDEALKEYNNTQETLSDYKVAKERSDYAKWEIDVLTPHIHQKDNLLRELQLIQAELKLTKTRLSHELSKQKRASELGDTLDNNELIDKLSDDNDRQLSELDAKESEVQEVTDKIKKLEEEYVNQNR